MVGISKSSLRGILFSIVVLVVVILSVHGTRSDLEAKVNLKKLSSTKAHEQSGSEGMHCFKLVKNEGNGWEKFVEKIGRIKVTLKDPKENPKYKVKICGIKYTDKTSGQIVEEAVTGAGVGESSDTAVPSEARIDKDTNFCVKVCLVKADGTNPITGLTNWVAATPTDPVQLNFTLLDASSAVLKARASGPSTIFNLSGLGATSVTEVAETAFELSAEDTVPSPDIIYCGWELGDGAIEVFPYGGLRYLSAPTVIYVFDEEGYDLIADEVIELGTPQVTPKGSILIPVLSVDQLELGQFAILARGAEVEAPTLSGDETAGYVIVGDALPQDASDLVVVANASGVVDNWETVVSASGFSWESLALGGLATTGEGPATSTYGGMPYVFNGPVGAGFLPAFTIAEAASGSFSNGTLVIEALDGMNFLASEDTRVSVVDADDHNISYSEYFTATISVCGNKLKVDLSGFDEEGVDSIRLAVVIASPKVAVTAPMAFEATERVIVGGSVLGTVLPKSYVVIEGGEEWDVLEAPLALGTGAFTLSGLSYVGD